MWTYNNELYHYGVLGMKWGVRKTIKSASPQNYFSARSTANRINKVAKDKERVGSMSKRQRESLKKSQAYWNARAAGKATPKRGFIRREADRYRSYSLDARLKPMFGRSTVGSIRSTHSARKLHDEFGSPLVAKPSYAKVPVSSIVGTGLEVGIAWVENRIFGHY